MTSPELDPDTFLALHNAEAQQYDREAAENELIDAFLNQCAADLELQMIQNGVDTTGLRQRLRDATGIVGDTTYDPLQRELRGIASRMDPATADKAREAGMPEDYVYGLTGMRAAIPQYKVYFAFNLIHDYDAASTVELRQLLDQLVPEDTPVSDLTEVDLELSPAGQQHVQLTDNQEVLTEMIVLAPQEIAELLDEQFGPRDDSKRLASIIVNYSLLRVVGLDASKIDDQVGNLLQQYPGGKDFLGKIIESLCENLDEDTVGHTAPRENWPEIFTGFDDVS